MTVTDIMPLPNADLIGFTFRLDSGGLGRVTGSAPWSDQYVLVECLEEDAEGVVQRRTTTRAAGLVRNVKQLEERT